MRDPLRSKIQFLVVTSLALALALGLASGFRWARGENVATPALAATAAQLEATSTQAPVVAELPALESREQGSLAPNFPALAEVSRAFVSIAQSVRPAVVSINTSGAPQRMRLPQRFEELFGPFHPELEETPFDVPLGRGSGFIVSKDGHVLTNNHVVANAERIAVELIDGRRIAAELVGRDPTTDIAVLKIEAENLPTVTLGNSEDASVGELVLAIGNPGTELTSALPFTVTVGIISAKGRNLGIIQRTARSEYAIEDLIQTDAVINPGNSGGPLVNYRGEVIGVNTAIQSTTGFYQGYGFAIPISLARNVMDDLIEFGRVRRAALRVQVAPVSLADAKAFKLPEPRGAVIQDFPKDSPAEKAGLKRGDVIVAVNSEPVERVGQLQRMIAAYEPGSRVTVTAIRYGEQLNFDVKLAEAPVPEPETLSARAADRPGNMLIGVQVRELTPQLVQWAGFQEDAGLAGVLVTNVARFGPAASAGLFPKMLIQRVNGRSIGNVEDFDAALQGVGPGDVVSIDAVWAGPDGEANHRIVNLEIPRN